MRASLYHGRRGLPPVRWGAALAVLAACTSSPPAYLTQALSRDAGPEPIKQYEGKSLHFSELLAFAPEKLLELQGGKATASTAKIGEVAVSEVERTYTQGELTAKIRIVDTSLNRGSRPPEPGPAFEDDRKIGRPVLTSGANGYVEFEKESRRAVANLIVADRVLVTLTLENARGPEDAERLAAALDLRRLEKLLQAQATP